MMGMEDPKLAGLTLRGVPLRAFFKPTRETYEAHRLLRRGPRKALARLGFPVDPPLEDWIGWYRGPLMPFAAATLGPGCHLSEYLAVPAMQRLCAQADVYMLGKLLSAELTLRLLRSGWQDPANGVPA